MGYKRGYLNLESARSIERYLRETSHLLLDDEKKRLFRDLIDLEIRAKEAKNYVALSHIGKSFSILGDHDSAYEIFKFSAKSLKEDSKTARKITKPGVGPHKDELIYSAKEFDALANDELKYLPGNKSAREAYWEDHDRRVKERLEQNAHFHETGRKKPRSLEFLVKRKSAAIIVLALVLSSVFFKFTITGQAILSSDFITKAKPSSLLAIIVIAFLVLFYSIKRD